MSEKNQNTLRDAVFYEQATFSLTPAEFLAFVWVYRNEIQPVFDKHKDATPTAPVDMRDYYSEIRSGILDGDLKDCELQAGEIKFFENQSENLFAPFKNSTDQIKKPDSALIVYARSTLADLITESGKGKLISLESSLVNGKITFTIGPAVETTLKRPY